jgi:hypothetical protein
MYSGVIRPASSSDRGAGSPIKFIIQLCYHISHDKQIVRPGKRVLKLRHHETRPTETTGQKRIMGKSKCHNTPAKFLVLLVHAFPSLHIPTNHSLRSLIHGLIYVEVLQSKEFPLIMIHLR